MNDSEKALVDATLMQWIEEDDVAARRALSKRRILSSDATLADRFDQIIAICNTVHIGDRNRIPVIKNIASNADVESGPRDKVFGLPKRFPFFVRLCDQASVRTVKVLFHYTLLTAGWVKHAVGLEAGMDLSEFVLQTAALDMHDDAWLPALGVLPGTVLTLVAQTGSNDTTSSVRLTNDYMNYCAERHEEFVKHMRDLMSFCRTHDTRPTEVIDHFGINHNLHDNLHDLD